MNRILETVGPMILGLVIGAAVGVAFTKESFDKQQQQLRSRNQQLQERYDYYKDVHERTAETLEAANKRIMEKEGIPFGCPGGIPPWSLRTLKESPVKKTPPPAPQPTSTP